MTAEHEAFAFPDGFWWGTASAGHQVEGNNVHSNWWEWEKLGLVADGTRSGRACEYWERFSDDHELMAQMGHNCARIGVEWARVEPEAGRFDVDAIARYAEMVEDLASRGLKVCLTLHHWVMPQWLAARGGWMATDALERWGRFLDRIIPAVAPHVSLWVTVNEPMVPVLAGHLAGYHPPMQKSPVAAMRVFNRLLEAHAIAYHRVHNLVPRAPGAPAPMVGYAAAYQWVEPFDTEGWRRPVEQAITRIVQKVSYKAWDDAIASGRLLGGRRVPGLAGSVDWLGVNYYMRISVPLRPSALSNVASGVYDAPEGIETTEMGWQVYPPGFRHTLMDAWERLGVPIWVTENGCSDSGDDMRRRYLLSHLAEMSKAISLGADIRGYFQWTFMDNFEWREGFAQRFGLVEVDQADPDLRRLPRQSAAMFSEVIAANAVTPDIVARHSPGCLDTWMDTPLVG